jgi:hypothetical protein
MRLISTETQSRRGYSFLPSDHVNALVLTAGAAKTATVPANATLAAFSATSQFYVNFFATAVIPSGDITNGSAPELSPTIRQVESGSTFSVVAPVDCIVTISYYNEE